MSDGKVRIGIIGCGAVTEIGHLPAVLANQDCTLTALVDRNTERTAHLGAKAPNAFAATDYLDCIGKIDAAIVALPHHLHAPITIDLLNRGIHVLVDKPMAMSAAECDMMVAAAQKAGRVLAVGLMRRHLYSAKLAKTLIETGALGKVRSFHFAEGGIYNWPVASDFFFKRRTAGGGVLLDTGAHTLDLLLWWLGDVASYEYFDDAEAADGVEADCLMRLVTTSGADGIVELSRTRNLRNTAFIVGELADMEIDLRKNWLAIYPKAGPTVAAGNLAKNTTITDLTGHTAHNFGAKIAIVKGGVAGPNAVEVDATEGKSSGQVFGLRESGILLPAQPLTDYTAHVYLKGITGDFENVPLLLRAGNADFKLLKASTITLTGEWKRHSISFTTGPGDDGVSIGVWKKDSATPVKWLADAIQLERGSGGGYYGPDRPRAILDSLGPSGPQTFTSLFHNQIADFVGAVSAGSPPASGGEIGKKSVELIEALYANREPLRFAWQEERVAS